MLYLRKDGSVCNVVECFAAEGSWSRDITRVGKANMYALDMQEDKVFKSMDDGVTWVPPFARFDNM